MQSIIYLLSLLCVLNAQSSAPKKSLAYPNAHSRQAEFERDQQEFLASGLKYKKCIRGTGCEGGGSYGHWFYKKIDGSIAYSFDGQPHFSDERDAWLFQAYTHNDNIGRLALNGWSADHADVGPEADSLLKKMENELKDPVKRRVTDNDESIEISVDNSPIAIIDWLAERLESQDEAALFQQLFTGLWRKRDKNLAAAIVDAQKKQEVNRMYGGYLDKEYNKKIAQITGCECKNPNCPKTEWKIARFENEFIYKHIIKNRVLPLGVLPHWICKHQGSFGVSKNMVKYMSIEAPKTLSSNPQFQHAIAHPISIVQAAPGGPIEIKSGQAASSSSKE